ncbi:uncharacterized protein LOC133183252 [Saccostrea echinata]|uniref:uncharacterized protein LOC133183252 n=1 Tax=Saccostrea echinata TaxID=191078 RepID=UPI002A7FE248|nr:uncharacterized protein LOC133183252 [Saccostrea echinata]
MTPLRLHMRPLHLTLGIFGLWHSAKNGKVEPELEKSGNNKELTKPRFAFKVLRIYCIFICCLLTFNVLRYIPSFWVGIDFVPGLTALRVVILLWYTQNAISAIVLFVFFDNKDHFQKYTEQYNRVISDQISKRLKTNPGCQIIRRCMIRNLVIGWSFVIFNSLLLASLIFSNIVPVFVVITCNPMSYTSVMVRILVCFIQFLNSGVWIFPIVLHYTLTTAIQLRFEELNGLIENTALDKCDDRFEIVKNVRQKHLQLCKMVETVDQSLSYYVANMYTANIALACFIAYNMINGFSTSSSIPETIILSFWLASSFFILFIISKKSATLHEKAHDLSSLVMDINLEGATIQDIAQINLLVSKLHGPSVGLSVLGIITITKEMILTLAGVFLTYFFLLVQFRI